MEKQTLKYATFDKSYQNFLLAIVDDESKKYQILKLDKKNSNKTLLYEGTQDVIKKITMKSS